MELADALKRLEIPDQAHPTADQVHTAWREQLERMGACDDLTKQRLLEARDRVLRYAEGLAANERALCERVENMRVLTYDSTDPMDEARAMYYMDLPRDAVVDRDEILEAWEKQIRGTIPRKGGSDPFSQERKLNRARDIMLERLKLPEYQEALRVRREEAARLAEQQLAVQQLAEQQLAEQQLAVQQLAEQQLAEQQLAVQQESEAQDIEFSNRRRKRAAQRNASECMDTENSDISDAVYQAEIQRLPKLLRAGAASGDRLRAKLLEGRRLVAERSASRPRLARKPTIRNKEGKELMAEMERVFAECFEPGARVMASDLIEVFARSTTLSHFSETFFTRHGKALFAAQWPDCEFKTFKHNRCFVGVQVKAQI